MKALKVVAGTVTPSVRFHSYSPGVIKNNARKKQKGGEKSGPCAVLVDGICHKKGQFDSLRKKKLFCLAPCSVASWVKVLLLVSPGVAT